MQNQKWTKLMPEPGSPRHKRLRVLTGLVALPFGAVATSVLVYHATRAVIAMDVFAVVALLGAGSWFGFITWATATFAFAGYYPRAFCRLWNVLWGWLAGRMPLPPLKRARSTRG